MKLVITLSLLLISLEVQCHHLPGHNNDQANQGDKTLLEHPHLSSEEQRQDSSSYLKIGPSNSDFAFRFYRNVASGADSRNIFFSPISISAAFALLTLGAKSETQSQIHKGLAFNLSVTEENEIHQGFRHLIHALHRPDNKAQVKMGNALFIEQSLKFLPKFLEDVRTFYEAEGFLTNFTIPREAKRQINDYVQNRTQGKIAHALEDLDPCTILVLVNYIFFKAYWQHPFDTHMIREKDFFVDANTTVKASLMYRKGYYRYLHDEDLSCWVVEIPYKGDATSFFILPDEGKLKQVEGALVKESLSKWIATLKSDNIRLFIPKFSISASYDVKDLLQKMGVQDVFNDAADLSGITGERELMVSKVPGSFFLCCCCFLPETGGAGAALSTTPATPGGPGCHGVLQ